LKWQGQAGKVI